VRGDLWTTLGLIGGVIGGVRSTPGRIRGGGRRVSKLNRCVKRPITVTETPNSSMFYSRFTRWFWLGFVPLGRATQVLQECLKDQGLVWLGFQTIELPSTLGANCVDSDLGKFGKVWKQP